MVFHGTAEQEEPLSVDLPRGVAEGNDYYIHVEQLDGEPASGGSQPFAIGPPRDAEWVPPEDWRVEILSPSGGETFYDGGRLRCRWKMVPDYLPLPDRVSIQHVSESSGDAVRGTTYPIGHSLLSFDATTRTYSYGAGGFEGPGSFRLVIEHIYNEVEGSDISGSFSGQSGVFTVLAEPSGEGVSLNKPAPGIRVRAGETIPVQWEIPAAFVDAYGSVTVTTLQLRDDDLSDWTVYEQEVAVDPDLRSFDLPTPETLPEGDYTVFIRIAFTEGFEALDESPSVHVLPSPDGEVVRLLEPRAGIHIRAGEPVPFRWIFDTFWEAAHGDPSSTLLDLYEAHDDVRAESRFFDRDVPSRLRSFDWPTSESLPAGEYRGRIMVWFEVRGDSIYAMAHSPSFTILPSGGLHFTWPDSREALTYGHTYPITWDAVGDAAHRDLSIYLVQSGAIVKTLDTGVPAGAGMWEYHLDIDCNAEAVVPRGEDYSFLLVSDGTAPFEATSPPVDILLPELLFNRGSPREGDRWPLGSDRQVLWTPVNVPEGATLKVELLKGGRVEAQLATGVSANGDYWEWAHVGRLNDGRMVPGDDDYRFRLTLEACDVVVSESPTFAIVAE